MSHAWGLLLHPDREMQVTNRENETASHYYTHYVLLMTTIPVICVFIGITQIGRNFDDGTILKLPQFTGLALAVLFYGIMLARVAVVGRIVWWMTCSYPQRLSLVRCMVFAGYVITPLFLNGLVVPYPLAQLCVLVGMVALFYISYLLYLNIPSSLNINKKEGLSFFSSTLAIGVLMLEVLPAFAVILWGYGYCLLQKVLLRRITGVNINNVAPSHDSSLATTLFARYGGVASLSKSSLWRCVTRACEPLSECSLC